MTKITAVAVHEYVTREQEDQRSMKKYHDEKKEKVKQTGNYKNRVISLTVLAFLLKGKTIYLRFEEKERVKKECWRIAFTKEETEHCEASDK